MSGINRANGDSPESLQSQTPSSIGPLSSSGVPGLSFPSMFGASPSDPSTSSMPLMSFDPAQFMAALNMSSSAFSGDPLVRIGLGMGIGQVYATASLANQRGEKSNTKQTPIKIEISDSEDEAVSTESSRRSDDPLAVLARAAANSSASSSSTLPSSGARVEHISSDTSEPQATKKQKKSNGPLKYFAYSEEIYDARAIRRNVRKIKNKIGKLQRIFINQKEYSLYLNFIVGQHSCGNRNYNLSYTFETSLDDKFVKSFGKYLLGKGAENKEDVIKFIDKWKKEHGKDVGVRSAILDDKILFKHDCNVSNNSLISSSAATTSASIASSSPSTIAEPSDNANIVTNSVVSSASELAPSLVSMEIDDEDVNQANNSRVTESKVFSASHQLSDGDETEDESGPEETFSSLPEAAQNNAERMPTSSTSNFSSSSSSISILSVIPEELVVTDGPSVSGSHLESGYRLAQELQEDEIRRSDRRGNDTLCEEKVNGNNERGQRKKTQQDKALNAAQALMSKRFKLGHSNLQPAVEAESYTDSNVVSSLSFEASSSNKGENKSEGTTMVPSVSSVFGIKKTKKVHIKLGGNEIRSCDHAFKDSSSSALNLSEEEGDVSDYKPEHETMDSENDDEDLAEKSGTAKISEGAATKKDSFDKNTKPEEKICPNKLIIDSKVYTSSEISAEVICINKNLKKLRSMFKGMNRHYPYVDFKVGQVLINNKWNDKNIQFKLACYFGDGLDADSVKAFLKHIQSYPSYTQMGNVRNKIMKFIEGDLKEKPANNSTVSSLGSVNDKKKKKKKKRNTFFSVKSDSDVKGKRHPDKICLPDRYEDYKELNLLIDKFNSLISDIIQKLEVDEKAKKYLPCLDFSPGSMTNRTNKNHKQLVFRYNRKNLDKDFLTKFVNDLLNKIQGNPTEEITAKFVMYFIEKWEYFKEKPAYNMGNKDGAAVVSGGSNFSNPSSLVSGAAPSSVLKETAATDEKSKKSATKKPSQEYSAQLEKDKERFGEYLAGKKFVEFSAADYSYVICQAQSSKNSPKNGCLFLCIVKTNKKGELDKISSRVMHASCGEQFKKFKKIEPLLDQVTLALNHRIGAIKVFYNDVEEGVNLTEGKKQKIANKLQEFVMQYHAEEAKKKASKGDQVSPAVVNGESSKTKKRKVINLSMEEQSEEKTTVMASSTSSVSSTSSCSDISMSATAPSVAADDSDSENELLVDRIKRLHQPGRDATSVHALAARKSAVINAGSAASAGSTISTASTSSEDTVMSTASASDTDSVSTASVSSEVSTASDSDNTVMRTMTNTK